jgi:ABC-2 type transport system permease protein/sodium transport system permease protein
LAKYLAVVTVSVLTATANLAAMSITLQATGIASAVLGTDGFAWRVIIMAFALLLVFAIFFSAVVLAVTSFARSFKEAQAYLIPLILMSLGPSLICLAPGVRLGPVLAVTPLINLVLLARAIFEGSPVSGLWLLVVVSSVLYSIAAVAVAARVFGSDAVLYGSDVTWRDFFRRPARTVSHVGSYTTVLALAAIMPAYILLTSVMSRISGTQIGWVLAGSAAVTIALFGLTPLAIAWHQRLKFSTGFQCRWPSPTAWLSAVLLGVSIWPILLWMAYAAGLTSAFTDRYDAGRELIDQFQRLPWPMVILLLAMVPAVAEEWFFRGFVFSSLITDSTPRKAILVSAFLFGLFHVLGASLAPERFLPSTAMGLVLGWLCWQAGSVFPGMLLHAVHNSALVSLAYFEDELARGGWLHPTPARVGLGISIALIAAVFAWWLMRRSARAVSTIG